jgi:hypothetical protein
MYQQKIKVILFAFVINFLVIGGVVNVFAAGQIPTQATPSYHCGPANGDLYGVPKGGRICSCKQEVPGDCKQMGENSCEGGVYECPVGSDNCGCKEKSTKPVKDFKTGAFGSGQKVIVAPGASSGSNKLKLNKLQNKAFVTSRPALKTIKKSTNKSRFVASLKNSTGSRVKNPAPGSTNVAITVNDCTFYGGTVQKDNSCGTKQSCIIGNNNGCITKATK